MKRKPVSFKINVCGYMANEDKDSLIEYINDALVGVLGVTLELNGMDTVQIMVDRNTVTVGEPEDFEGQTQEEKVNDILQNATEVFGDAEVDEVDEYDIALNKNTIH